MSTPFRHIGVNCSSAQTEVVTGDPLLQLDNTLKETEPLCRLDMHSDTTIEEHHHFKVFCYKIIAAILNLSAIFDPESGFINIIIVVLILFV